MRAAARRLLQRALARMYSLSASTWYDAVVVRRSLPLIAGDLEARVGEQARRAATAAAGRPVLDLPVGTGHFTLEWSGHHNGLVVGVDIAAGMVRKTAARAAELGVSNLVALQSDAQRLPFRSGAFGAVMCTNGLQVMPGLEGALREMRRMLAPSGVLLVTAIHVPLGALMPRRVAAHLPALLRSRGGLVEALKSAGLEVTAADSSRLALFIEAKPAG